jgi:hypothetical protein
MDKRMDVLNKRVDVGYIKDVSIIAILHALDIYCKNHRGNKWAYIKVPKALREVYTSR